MYKRLVLSILFFILSSLAWASNKTSPILPIEHWTTPQGLRVYFVPSHELPIIDMQLVFDAGSSRDGSRPGLAYLTASMLKRGTPHLTADDIASLFDERGALLSLSTEHDMARISFRSLVDSEFLTPTLQALIEILSKPTFPEKEFRQQQKQALNSLQELHQTPSYVASEMFYQTVYGKHPYAHPIMGTSVSLNNLSPRDLENFHRQYYTPNNAILSIVGNINRRQAETISEQISKSLPENHPLPKISDAAPLKNTVTRHVSFPSSQTHILIGQVGITPNDPDYFPLLVGDYILGGGALVSQLATEVREKHGYAYDIKSQFRFFSHRGLFLIRLQTKSDQKSSAEKIVFDVLKKFMTQGPTEKELTNAKSHLIGGFPLRIASNKAIVRMLTQIGFYQRPLDYLDTFQERVMSVTTGDIRNAFKRHLDPEALAIVTVGKE